MIEMTSLTPDNRATTVRECSTETCVTLPHGRGSDVGLGVDEVNSICIVRLSAIGDVLMLVPMVRSLQAKFPNAKITWIISRPAYDCVEGMSGVDFIVLDKPKNIIDYARFWLKMRAYQFDVLLAPQASFRANLLYPLIRATRKIGYDDNRANDGHRYFVKEQIDTANEHTLDGFMRFATTLGATPVYEWNMPLTDDDSAWASAHCPSETPVLLINPCASKPERTWSTSGYIEVIKQLKAKMAIAVVLIGGPGPADRAMADAIKSEVDVIDYVGKTKPRQLMALIEKATLVLCPDTGPSHMAAAVGTPVVALHAVTNPEISGPYTFRQYVVNAYPDNQPWGSQMHGVNAMDKITVEAVVDKVIEVLSSL